MHEYDYLCTFCIVEIVDSNYLKHCACMNTVPKKFDTGKFELAKC